MTDSNDTEQVPKILTFEPLGFLANQSTSDDSTNEPRQLETYANQLTANIIKDASQSASKTYDDNSDNTGMDDNTNELNFSLPQTSKQNQSENTTVALDKSEYSATNGTHDENDFDDEDIQKKMNGVIQDIQSQSVNDTPRKSVVSNHLHDDQTNNTTEGPRRSISETALTNHSVSTEPTLPLPNRQDESSSDADEMFGIKTAPINVNSTNNDSIDPYGSEQDNRKNNQLDDTDDFFNTKVASVDDDQQPTNIIKSNNLDETTRFGTTSSSRVQSASSKRSIRLTPDEPSTSGDEKRTELSPSKVPDDTGNDTDRDNQEVATIARRPSRAISPLGRPRSPTPNDSLKVSTNNVPSSFPPGQTQSPTDVVNDDDNQQKQIIEPSTSRRQSINKNDQQQGSRPTSAIQTKFDDNSYEPTTSRTSSSRTNQFITTEDQSKLIRPGEQLQIPSDDLDNERTNSPPPLPTNISSLLLANPLFGSSLVENEQDQSRPSSGTNRKSPTTSMMSNEKVIDGDILPSKSRRESTISQQQLNNTDQKVASRRESQTIEQTPQISSSRRTSTAQQQDELDNNKEQKPASRKESNASQQQPPSRKESTASEQKPASRKESNASQQQPPSKRESVTPEPQVSSRRDSTADEQKPASRKESNASQQKPASRKESTASEQKPASKRGSVAPEPQISSRRQSTADEPQVSSRRDSFVPEQQASSRRESNADEQKPSSRRESTALEQKTHSRKESTASGQKPASRKESNADEQKPSSRRESTALEQKSHSRKESNASEQKPASRKESTASEHQVQSKRGSVAPEPQISSRRESTNEEQKVASRKSSTNFEQEGSSKRQSPAPEQQISSRRESHVSNQQVPYHRQSSSDQAEQNSSSKPVSRKSSVAEQQQQQIPSRRESQQQVSTSRRTSTNRDNQPTSPRRSSNVHNASSRDSSRRNSITKQEQLTVPVNPNKDSRQSSYKEASPSVEKRQKSSSTADENDRRQSSFQRRSEQDLKRNSNINTDETVVTPIIMDSSKVRQNNGKRLSITDSSYDQTSLSKLPPVSSSFQQEKPRRSETSNKQQIPISNRSDIKHLSSSHATSPSEDDRPTHWTKTIPIPSIHLSDDENISSREDQPRPQSPNVEQIAERNQAPSPPLITTSTAKKRSAQDRQKRKQQHRLSRRSTSADSVTHIQLVDDHSLDSTSDVNTDFDSHKRRHIKLKKKDVETNTDQIYDSRQQRSFFDEKELSPQRPLKATKPLSDHLHSTRRRTQNKEQILTTPDSIPDTDTTTVRRSVKQTKDSNQDKDPVHVNVTVVVKKFAGTTKDGTQHTTAEAFVEQKPQQYFEPVQHPPEILPPPSTTTENKEKLDESIDRPKSTDQSRIKSTQQTVVEHSDRHTQSDTEQIITDKQKKRRRPKRISRTCQTYECVFRRMERDQQQDLRTTSDTEKNIQTRKSQLRPRKKSPKKNLPVYLSPDSFHLEELLPKQYHQSRRNMSKSSAIARSLSPQGGKLLILRPTLPFHHTDAVNVHRVCLQYAIDLVPNENLSSAPMTSNRNKLSVLKQSEQTNHIPMISASSSGVNIPTQKSNTKEKAASNKTDDYTHYRKNGGAV